MAFDKKKHGIDSFLKLNKNLALKIYVYFPLNRLCNIPGFGSTLDEEKKFFVWSSKVVLGITTDSHNKSYSVGSSQSKWQIFKEKCTQGNDFDGLSKFERIFTMKSINNALS